jgi:acyl carrier protein
MSTESTIERFIVDEIMIGAEKTNIEPEQSLLESGILDSLALLRLIGFIEDQYEITIEDGEVTPDNFDSIASIKNFLVQKSKSD